MTRLAGRLAVPVLLALHAGLLGYCAWSDSPTRNEVGQLAAGAIHWRDGRFDVGLVNPPLLRLVAAAPISFFQPNAAFALPAWHVRSRPEISAGKEFILDQGPNAFWWFTVARWMCIPFSLLGGYTCSRWARELYGAPAGLVALVIWCFGPNIIAHGHLITTDVSAASLGVAAAYCFRRWLKNAEWTAAMLAGIALGLAELAKFTWIVLFVIWPLAWLLSCWIHRRSASSRSLRPSTAAQFLLIISLSLLVINLGYSCEGSFRRLGDHKFVSAMFGGPAPRVVSGVYEANRFRDSWMAAIPVPLPENYLQGIDLQKCDFENRFWSYLRGEWRLGGWWYYYLYALAIKVPLGTLLLLLLAIASTLRTRLTRVLLGEEVFLLGPPLIVLATVSSHMGFNHHLRYVLPAFPFAIIWLSKVATRVNVPACRTAVVLAIIWSVTSSLTVYPHSLSYFNELVGGPQGGHRHLGDSNTDWGQDLLYLKAWLRQHPEACPIALACDLPLVEPRSAGIEYTLPPPSPHWTERESSDDTALLGPLPGWYAISVNQLHCRSLKYDYFQEFTPSTTIGYSFCVYHITPQEADAVRRRFSLPEIRAPLPGERLIE